MGLFRLIFGFISFFTFSLTFAQTQGEPIRFNFRDELFRIQDFEVDLLKDRDGYQLIIKALNDQEEIDERIRGEYKFLVNKSDTITASFDKGITAISIDEPEEIYFIQYLKQSEADAEVYSAEEGKLIRFLEDEGVVEKKEIPLWLSLLPPLLAIALALIFKEVIVSLTAGVWIGAFAIYGFDFKYFFISLFSVIDKYIITALMDTGHLSVILFSLMLGGMVAIISRNGGMAGIVQWLSKYAKSSKSSQLITYILGIAIFFDDYANTLIVGNTMKPVTDSFRVSREKLAYIVDSTAAPVAAIAFVTTWIGAELGYIGTQTEVLGINESAYSIFLNSLEYAYYPLFTLVFMLMLILMNKDFGSMRKAEIRARETGKIYEDIIDRGSGEVDDSLKSFNPIPGARLLWYNAFFPILTVVIVTIIGLLYTGSAGALAEGEGLFDNFSFNKLTSIIGAADSYVALLWASLSGIVVAMVLSLATKTLSFRLSVEAMMDGFKTMLPAIVILVLAWSLAQLTLELHTADFLTNMLSGKISPRFMGVITFILAAIISFSTGSSWSTMAILYPIALPTTWVLSQEAGLSYEASMEIMYNVTAVVLGGSVFGDHCSPISDTTVLSSLASGCNHIDHVRTQLPYALTVGVVSIIVDGFFYLLQLPWWIDYFIGFGLLYLVVWKIAKPVPEYFIQKETA